ncbi:phage tail assembly chaperone [Pseudomonas sp. SWRI153]|uniref:Phage tail assembly chaperone n=1 Tax=Pseudomonas khorasanensis TaxID=2745508 RepID=A0A923JG73_9PSED|nr:hypothetical protein [Pseudomonas khorasanensis]MBV4486927.1 phage tail assembly chaperone [Pseudomonas khorasanensis]
MANYARVENGVVVERIDTGEYAISQLFAPLFVESMVRVPDGQDVEIGAPVGEFSAIAEPMPAEQNRALVQAPVVAEQDSVTPARTWREATLSTTEWLVARHRDERDLGHGTSLSARQYLELLEHRQALREWPESALFPAADSRPAAPTWLASVTG